MQKLLMRSTTEVVSTSPTARVLRVAACIAMNGPISHGEIVGRTGIPKAAVWRMVHALRQERWVRLRECDNKLEFTNSLDRMLAGAHFADQEFESFPVLLRDLSMDLSAELDLTTFSAPGVVTILQTTRRGAEGMAAMPQSGDPAVTALFLACNSEEFERNLEGYRKKQKHFPEALDNITIARRDQKHRETCQSIDELSGTLAVGFRGPLGTPAAIRVERKPSRRPTSQRTIIAAINARLFDYLPRHIL
jgi:DNA-binding IclR family transcriptional regulator